MSNYNNSYYDFNTYNHYVVVNDKKRLLGVFNNEHDIRLSKYLSGNGNITFPCKSLSEATDTVDVILNKLYSKNSLIDTVKNVIVAKINKFHNLNEYIKIKDFVLTKKSK